MVGSRHADAFPPGWAGRRKSFSFVDTHVCLQALVCLEALVEISFSVSKSSHIAAHA